MDSHQPICMYVEILAHGGNEISHHDVDCLYTYTCLWMRCLYILANEQVSNKCGTSLIYYSNADLESHK